MDNSISIEKSKSIKFIAVIMMVFYHLFAFPDRIKNVSFISIYKINNIPIEFFISSFMGICVSIFLFISGYGLYKKYGENFKFIHSIQIIKKLYKNYIIVFCLFVPIGYIMGKYHFEIKEVILNLSTLSSSLNGEWWFLNLYFMLVISYPIGIFIVSRLNLKISIVWILGMNFFGMILTKFILVINTNNLLLKIFSIYFVKSFYFYFGILVAKYSIFDRLNNKLNLKKVEKIIILFLITLALIFKLNIPILGEYVNMALQIIFIYLLVNMISSHNYFNRASKHTTNIWLTHSFFVIIYFNIQHFCLSYLFLYWFGF